MQQKQTWRVSTSINGKSGNWSSSSIEDKEKRQTKHLKMNKCWKYQSKQADKELWGQNQRKAKMKSVRMSCPVDQNTLFPSGICEFLAGALNRTHSTAHQERRDAKTSSHPGLGSQWEEPQRKRRVNSASPSVSRLQLCMKSSQSMKLDWGEPGCQNLLTPIT